MSVRKRSILRHRFQIDRQCFFKPILLLARTPDQMERSCRRCAQGDRPTSVGFRFEQFALQKLGQSEVIVRLVVLRISPDCITKYTFRGALRAGAAIYRAEYVNRDRRGSVPDSE